jgi:hypothetical protein
MTQYTTKPAQFRLPPWAHEFLAEEAASTGTSKTEVVLEALEEYKRMRFEEHLAEGYREWADENLAQAQEWDSALMDGLEPGRW